MDFAYALAKPLLFRLDPEAAHGTTLRLAAVAGAPGLRSAVQALYRPKPDPRLAMQAFGLSFEHPLGLAAGVDKDGVAIDAWGALGFGFIEVGTVTPGEGQAGNPTPRLARLVEDRAVVNRMGFPNGGAPRLARRLERRTTKVPVGANIGKAKRTPNASAVEDYRETLRDVFPVSDYIVVNVSSPNTPGLRDLQTVAALEPLLSGVLAENTALAATHALSPRPVLLKIAPDLADDDVDAVADLALGLGLDGLVATNTTLRHDLVSPPPPIAGGLSGAPLGPRALALTRRLYRRLDGQVPIVGVGGIMSAEDAWARIRAGATLLQTYTGLIYEGPGLIRSVCQGLSSRLEAAGLDRLEDAVGVDA